MFEGMFQNMFQVSEELNIQLKSDKTERLLNKPYVNEVYLTGQNLT